MIGRSLLLLLYLSWSAFAFGQSQLPKSSDRLSLLSEFVQEQYSAFYHPIAGADTHIAIYTIGMPRLGTNLLWEASYCEGNPHPKPPPTIPSILNPLSESRSDVRASSPELPGCGNKQIVPLLSAQFEFEWNHNRWWIKTVRAGGEYLLKDIDDLEKSFHEHFVRSDKEGIQRFHEHGAQFGPDRKKELLASIDTKQFFELTGCRLDMSKVEFQKYPKDEDVVDPHTTRYLGHLRWIIYGLRSPQQGCMAEFEPMHGRLVMLLDTFPH
jgi:hypothetical protein